MNFFVLKELSSIRKWVSLGFYGSFVLMFNFLCYIWHLRQKFSRWSRLYALLVSFYSSSLDDDQRRPTPSLNFCHLGSEVCACISETQIVHLIEFRLIGEDFKFLSSQVHIAVSKRLVLFNRFEDRVLLFFLVNTLWER